MKKPLKIQKNHVSIQPSDPFQIQYMILLFSEAKVGSFIIAAPRSKKKIIHEIIPKVSFSRKMNKIKSI